MNLDPHVPSGPLAQKWDKHRFEMKLVNPANKRKFRILIVGTGLAGGSAAASLAELGYNVESFCFQDSSRRAHSIAAQGGINAAKNYQNDGDSIRRLFYDTIKGGDFRSREANVYRLAQVSVNIIDQCVAQGVPFAREYGGLLFNRSFGGAQVSRTFYCRGQTGQQLLLGAYQAMSRQVRAGRIKMHPRSEMLDVVVVDGRARGIIVRDLVTGQIQSYSGDAVVLATGGYSPVFFLSTNAKGCNVTAGYRAYKRGAAFANPCYTQIHPTCIPVTGDYQSKLTLMSESLRNDGRIWVPRDGGDHRPPQEIPEADRDYYLERKYPSFGNLAPRDIASRAAKEVCDEGRGVGEGGRGVYLDFKDAIARLGEHTIRERYSNLFDMYHHITSENPYKAPMRIYPAPHYTMGGLWVDYNLMSSIPGLFVVGEANFSDHGANRLGASALMQGLADGYFVLPYTLSNYLASTKQTPTPVEGEDFKRCEAEVREQLQRLLSIKGKRSAQSFHRQLGKLMWDQCGMARSEQSLKKALNEIPAIRDEFWHNVSVTGGEQGLNQELEYAGRVADFLEFAELLCHDALDRDESCGAHFRIEHQTPDGEAERNDEQYSYVSAWEYNGVGQAPTLHKEPLTFEEVHLSVRSYK
ncbi:MAG TPA: fumarate reductase/succinate dehydrogenase flavoprotein subunit [Gemmataceae bacterium]|nr:fumarate reductase/succinate dehydrogenase flavoprotein subunit [Gemmataceae bacterium]